MAVLSSVLLMSFSPRYRWGWTLIPRGGMRADRRGKASIRRNGGKVDAGSYPAAAPPLPRGFSSISGYTAAENPSRSDRPAAAGRAAPRPAEGDRKRASDRSGRIPGRPGSPRAPIPGYGTHTRGLRPDQREREWPARRPDYRPSRRTTSTSRACSCSSTGKRVRPARTSIRPFSSCSFRKNARASMVHRTGSSGERSIACR